jgi:hypothetical protein
MTDPVSRTILLLDIEKYSDRDDVDQEILRRKLYDIANHVLEAAGIDETLRSRADRGDSVMELIDASASVRALLRALLTEMPSQLHAYNREASSTSQIRLRGVVANGYVAVDERGGWVGSDLNHACRLLDAQLLREALRARADGFALCVSEGVHAGIVRHDHVGVPAADFHPVTVTSKNGPLRAWLHGPVPAGGHDHADTGAGETPVPGSSGEGPAPGSRGAETSGAPADAAAAAAPAAPAAPARGGGPAGGGAVFNFGSGSPRFGGSLVGGDQHGVSGGQVTGDVHLGGTAGEGA